MPAAILLSLFLAAAPPPAIERGGSRVVFVPDSKADRGTIALTIDATACPAADAFSIAIARAGATRKSSLQLDRRAAARVRELAVDAGRYQLTIAAAGCRPLTRDVDVEAGKRVVLGTQSPRATPRLTGRVLGNDGKPFAGATVASPDEKTLAIADEAGRFSADPGDDWPSFLNVSAPGFAEALVAVPAVHADAELAPITLEKGTRLDFAVDRASAGDVPLTIRLFRLADRQRPSLCRTAKLATTETTRTFAALAPGDYLGELAGPSPFQRLTEELTVRADAPAKWKVKLAPTHLRAQVLAGTEPVANAESTFRDRRGLWTASLRFDAAGRAEAELWQGGTFSVVTTAPGMPSPNLSLESIAGDAVEAEWTLRLATNRVSGIVVDEAGTPIAAARLWLRTDTPDGVTATLPATTDSSGRFTFASVAAGAQSLDASADGFLPADATAFTLDDSRPEHEARVVLRKGVAQELDVTTTSGAPIAGATVIPWTAGLPLQLYATDAAGHVRLQLPAAASTVFVFPREGSFAIAHPRVDKAASAPLPIVVPDGTASIELDAKSLAGAPIADVIALMRVNGDLFPPDVLESLRRTQGVVLRSGSDGRLVLNHMPPGVYEFWPHGNLEEANAILANLSDAAPVQLAVRPGPNTATLTFRSAAP